MSAMSQALRQHWPEYLMEGALLGIFMISAGVFTVLMEYPDSPVHLAIGSGLIRRALVGLAMGLTAVCLIYSPWGGQSGAHFNPAVTLTFLRLGKVAPWDAVFYIAAQFTGGMLGVMAVAVVLGHIFTGPPVSYAATLPGTGGEAVAFLAEMVISFGLMFTVLFTMNTGRLYRFTGAFSGLLVAIYITVEAPYSGMSMNPARTLASALPSGLFMAVWIYFTAPVLGMLTAVEIYRAATRGRQVVCAKLNHRTHRRCIFLHCQYKG